MISPLQRCLALAVLATLAGMTACRPDNAAQGAELEPCRVSGYERELRCGTVSMPENPDDPTGRRIDIRFMVVDAVARNKQPDPVFVLAGGPGQAASRLIGQLMPMFAELNARRDIVFVDQRGTGQSNPLDCPDPDESLAIAIDPSRQADLLKTCLKAHPADTRQYATWIAVRDLDAVRARLGADHINLWGASYGTRVALEYLRQFPERTRTAVLDGVAPPDMVLPAAYAIDAEEALRKLVAQCRSDARCAAQYPDFEKQIDALLARADRGLEVEVRHPLSGTTEKLRVDRHLLAALLRSPLYVPTLGAILPHAIAAAGAGDLGPLVTATASIGGRVKENFSVGMHFAVVCAEDLPLLVSDRAASAVTPRFGSTFADFYRDVCQAVAIRPVPPEFLKVGRSDVPVLVLSGGMDPATPPRHGEAVAEHLGNAKHVVAPNLGHGISTQGCTPRLITRFIREGGFDGLETECVEKIPSPGFFEPIRPERAAEVR